MYIYIYVHYTYHHELSPIMFSHYIFPLKNQWTVGPLVEKNGPSPGGDGQWGYGREGAFFFMAIGRPIKTIDDGNWYLYLGINSPYWYFHGNRDLYLGELS